MANEKLTVRIGADTAGFEKGMRKVGAMAGQTAKRVAQISTAFVIAAAVIGSKFESAITKVGVIARASEKDLKKLEKKARDLGRTTAFTATQSAEAMENLARAGLKTNQIIEATQDAMHLAGATGVEMSEATTLLAATISQFGLEANDSRRIVDTFSAAMSNSLLDMTKLREAMKYAGTTGAALGWTLEQTTAAVAMFANLGLEGSMAGTNLRMSMISLAKGAGATKEALKELGFTINDELNPEAMAFGEILKELANKSISATQASEIFGARSGLNMKQLSKLSKEGKLNFEDFVKTLEEAQKGIGLTAKQYNEMMDTFRGQWKIMLSAMQELMITIFDTFGNEGKIVFQLIKKEIDKLTTSIKNNQQRISKFVDTIDIAIKGFIKIGKDAIEAGKLVGAAFQNALSGWNTLPRIIQEVGILGALFFGIKGIVVLALITGALGELDKFLKKVKEINETPWLEGALKPLEDTRRRIVLLQEKIEELQKPLKNKDWLIDWFKGKGHADSLRKKVEALNIELEMLKTLSRGLLNSEDPISKDKKDKKDKKDQKDKKKEITTPPWLANIENQMRAEQEKNEKLKELRFDDFGDFLYTEGEKAKALQAFTDKKLEISSIEDIALEEAMTKVFQDEEELREERIEKIIEEHQNKLDLIELEKQALSEKASFELKIEKEIAAAKKKIEKTKSDYQWMVAAETMKASSMVAKVLMDNGIMGFKTWQAIAMASAVVTTADAAIIAYKDGLQAGGPYGPIVGAAYAAQAIAMGAAQIAAISSANPGVSSTPTAPSASVAGVPYISPGTTDATITTEEQRPTFTIIVKGNVISDDENIEKLAEKLSEKVENYNLRLVSSEAVT